MTRRGNGDTGPQPRDYAWAVDREAGMLLGAAWQPSPNCDERPTGAEPEVLVVHAISLPPGRRIPISNPFATWRCRPTC